MKRLKRRELQQDNRERPERRLSTKGKITIDMNGKKKQMYHSPAKDIGKSSTVRISEEISVPPPGSGMLKSWGCLRAVMTAWTMTAGSNLNFLVDPIQSCCTDQA